MTHPLAEYWRHCAGTIHPDDQAIFDDPRYKDHGFNTDYPPVPFVGDIVNAPVVILQNNGGWCSTETPSEFPNDEACKEHRRRLANPQPVDDQSAPYYLSLKCNRWLRDGSVAIVNCVGYRSKNTKQAHVVAMSKALPSAIFHRRWLETDLLPEARQGTRLAIIHRWGLWKPVTARLDNHPNIHFSANPVSKNLADDVMEICRGFLADHPSRTSAS